MKKIVLISCVKKKLESKAKAGDLYISNWFKLARRYADKQKPDRIFILSAKYGLLDLETEIETYNVTLNEKTSAERKEWVNGVAAQLKEKADLKNDHFIFLAGQKYREDLIGICRIPDEHCEIPMKGLGRYEQLPFLKRHLNE